MKKPVLMKLFQRCEQAVALGIESGGAIQIFDSGIPREQIFRDRHLGAS